ncbi:hypothetical protein KZP23_05990 [Echinicola marina]|uniref:hypothetical protein n=1 Tax=Echinicola marina TaxID=2859768 RepID=UPI001CF6484C|nr:hypothetical protein [Echinicola marina]UCS94569.1 hypothetical protein KZP23_05990 [Echinicola marina]
MNKKENRTGSKELVWYASYGSNLLEERFLCYIQGGQPKHAARTYDGCVDKSLPKDKKGLIIHHELYFAKEASVWHNGGVAFIHKEKDLSAKIFGRMYLITKDQFMDVVMQENALKERPNVDFCAIEKEGAGILAGANWYNTICYLGKEEAAPIFTFTHENVISPKVKPHPSYLSTIIAGIKETFKLSEPEIMDYLSTKEGVKEV